MILSDKQILNYTQENKIIIEPFDINNLSTSSYDVTLGPYFYREDKNCDIFNPYDKNSVNKTWGTYKKAKTCEEYNIKLKNINKNQKIILIKPGETILAHTNEFIGGLNNITTMMKARSSMGRCFIEICKCAGWGDVGYINRWTMEITNNSQYHTIPLLVGSRIAQIIFLETGEIIGDDYKVKGKYNQNLSLNTLKEEWKPTDMLPKLYMD